MLSGRRSQFNFKITTWHQNKVIDRESRLIHRKIKGDMYSLKNRNHTKKVPNSSLEYGFLVYGSS